ncbi:hypothetical protein EYF80_009595 [Liparis tanakae]|uniref:Uncharacterized protein n=1 Tax=Liparis tanakae TaxID=230148 RepID=A0A4Z2IQK0_9TELE|nr:hypothetical protein EYF80_009595 [Liparis tanakae]
MSSSIVHLKARQQEWRGNRDSSTATLLLIGGNGILICCYETLTSVLLSWQHEEQEAGLRAPWRSSPTDGLSVCAA